MGKLDKVIAGLDCCADTDRTCEGCPYEDLYYCEISLLKDALDVIGALMGDNDRLRKMLSDTTKKLSVARAERDRVREKLARITGEKYAEWLSESGEPVPEFPKEGM